MKSALCPVSRSLALWLATACLLLMVPALGAQPGDPFATDGLSSSLGALDKATPYVPCQAPASATALSLVQVVDVALCNHPQTREIWANARYQAAQVGQARSAWLPNLNGSVSASRINGDGANPAAGAASNQTLAGVNVSWLLYDFGGRDAALNSAEQLLAAANASQDATLQSLLLAVVQAWSQWLAAQAAVDAAGQSERSSEESFKAAKRRYEVGSATPADRLQAQTAWSQAVLARIKAQGDARIARGVLMNAMGLEADDALSVAIPASPVAPADFAADLEKLMADARRLRPDLAAAQAQVQAAQAGVAQATAAGKPSIALSAAWNNAHGSSADPSRSSSLGVTLSIPIFTGYSSSYRIRAAQEQVQIKQAQLERLRRQVSLDVWKAYHSLVTATQALQASADLLASAGQSQKVARGRYAAGVGAILDLLNAESALASARQQDVQARYNWLSAKFSLAQAVGQLSPASVALPAP